MFAIKFQCSVSIKNVFQLDLTSLSTSFSAAGRATAHVPTVDEGLVAQLVSEALAIFVRSILHQF